MDWPTIIVASVIALILVLIFINHICNKKKGKHSCSCGSCGGCAMSDVCHKKANE